jgi:uncharacterized protein involved in exopolysaccharide biosynthesis
MKHWVRLASHLYPASWRRRYATEFDAMLDEMDASWKDVFDILKGAVNMQVTSWNLKSIVLTFAAIGIVVAAAAAFSIPTEYQSITVLRLSAGSAHGNAQFAQYIHEMEPEILSRTSLERMITGYDLYKSQRKDKLMEDIVQDMRTRDIAIKMVSAPGGQQNDSAAFMVSYVYSDPELAQTVTRDLVTKFMEQGNVTVQRGSEIRNAQNLEVLDPPSRPRQPISPNKSALIFTGLCAGLLVGLTVSYALRWRIAVVRRDAH